MSDTNLPALTTYPTVLYTDDNDADDNADTNNDNAAQLHKLS